MALEIDAPTLIREPFTMPVNIGGYSSAYMVSGKIVCVEVFAESVKVKQTIYPKSFTDYLKMKQPNILLDDTKEFVFYNWGRDRYKIFAYDSLEDSDGLLKQN